MKVPSTEYGLILTREPKRAQEIGTHRQEMHMFNFRHPVVVDIRRGIGRWIIGLFDLRVSEDFEYALLSDYFLDVWVLRMAGKFPQQRRTDNPNGYHEVSQLTATYT